MPGRPARMVIGLVLALGCAAAEPRDEHDMTPLMRAAAAGQLAQVRAQLARGADVNARVRSNNLREFLAFLAFFQSVPKREVGYTALVFAAAGGHDTVVRELLRAGAQVNPGSSGESAALRAALGARRPDLVRLLLDAGACPGEDALTLAASYGDNQTARLFLAHGVPVNPRYGSPLMVAVRRGNAELTKLLIDHGADVFVREPFSGRTPLAFAVEGGNQAIVRLLREAGAVDDGQRDAGLIEAIGASDAGRVEDLLRAGARPQAKDKFGSPALLIAADRSSAAVVRALVAHGADPKTERGSEGTPLFLAARRGALDVVKVLLDAGARPSGHGGELTIAAGFGHLGVIDALLAAGADVNENRGEPVRYTAWQGQVDAVRRLIAAGADVKLADNAGITALVRAGVTRNVGRRAELIRILREAGAER